MREKLHRPLSSGLLILPLAALLAVLPMLIAQPSCGHDFDFHLLSWLEASTQIAHLHLPQWAYTPAFNAGEPRFIFYPPLSWTLGALLGLILPSFASWNFVPAAFIWVALTLAGLNFRRLARPYTSPASATLGAVVYLANPYMLFTAYERSAFAELLAAAWLPLLLAAALPRPNDVASIPRRTLRVALPLALIWLTNAPAAVMFTYALAFLTLLRLALPARQSDPEPGAGAESPHLPRGASSDHRPDEYSRTATALSTLAGTALGLALAAIYIVPAAFERRFVQIQMVIMEGMRVDDHFLFHRMAGHSADDLFHNAVVRTASIIAVTLIVATLLAAFAALRRQLALDTPPAPPLLPPLLILTAVIAFLLLPLSLSVWHHLPQLAFLQFPWRLSAILGAIFALLFTLALPRIPAPERSGTTFLYPLLAALLFVLPAWSLFHQACDVEDSIPARLALYHSPLGTDSTDEYTPADADPDALHPHDPPYWLIPTQTPGAPPYASPAPVDTPAPAGLPPGPAPAHLELRLPAPSYLILNRRAYPNWTVLRNHLAVTSTEVPRSDGLIALPLPSGPSTIDLAWKTTLDQRLGRSISAAALLLAAALALFKKHRSA